MFAETVSFASPRKSQDLIKAAIVLEGLRSYMSALPLGTKLREAAEPVVETGRQFVAPCPELLQQARHKRRIGCVNLVFQRYDRFAATGIALPRAPSK